MHIFISTFAELLLYYSFVSFFSYRTLHFCSTGLSHDCFGLGWVVDLLLATDAFLTRAKLLLKQ